MKEICRICKRPFTALVERHCKHPQCDWCVTCIESRKPPGERRR